MQIPPLSANRLSNYFLAKGERRGRGGGVKKRGADRRVKGGRGTEEGRDIPPQSWGWRRAGKQEVRCPARRVLRCGPRPPPLSPGAPRSGWRGPPGALFAAFPWPVHGRLFFFFLPRSALCMREPAPFVSWRVSGRKRMGPRAEDLSVPGVQQSLRSGEGVGESSPLWGGRGERAAWWPGSCRLPTPDRLQDCFLRRRRGYCKRRVANLTTRVGRFLLLFI